MEPRKQEVLLPGSWLFVKCSVSQGVTYLQIRVPGALLVHNLMYCNSTIASIPYMGGCPIYACNRVPERV